MQTTYRKIKIDERLTTHKQRVTWDPSPVGTEEYGLYKYRLLQFVATNLHYTHCGPLEFDRSTGIDYDGESWYIEFEADEKTERFSGTD